MKRLAVILVLTLSALTLMGLWLSRPNYSSVDLNMSDTGDPEQGRYIYIASGCASCHIEKGSSDKFTLAGGQNFVTDFGVFYAPNISMSKEHGIGNWSLDDFSNAVRQGINPQGQHYFPAFPYVAYSKMTDQDLIDLWAFWQTLPINELPSQAHEIPWPFSMRQTLGLWKRLFSERDYRFAENTRGAYLVEALGHCGECHTARNRLGGLNNKAWLKGAPTPDGRGKVPSLAPFDLGWTEDDIVYYLETGFTPEYDVVGGHMAAVIENTSQLTLGDRREIARYLLALPQ